MLACCSFDMKFQYMASGHDGSAADARMFQHARYATNICLNVQSFRDWHICIIESSDVSSDVRFPQNLTPLSVTMETGALTSIFAIMDLVCYLTMGNVSALLLAIA